jgi:ribosomal protein S25
MDDEQKPDESEIREDINNQYQRITDMLTQKLRDQIENEPGITLEELQRDVQLEMGMTDEMLEQLRNAPTITEQQINQIRNNGSDVTGEGF